MLLLLLSPLALAESAATFPQGGASLYAGLGAYSFQKLRLGADPADTSTLYRDVTARAELYGGVGVTDRLMVTLSVPLVHSRVLDPPARDPSFPCGPISTVGTVAATVRYQIHRRWLDVTPGIAVSSAAWNAPTRGYYNTVGEATTDVGPVLYVGDRYGDARRGLSWVVSAGYTVRTTAYEASGGAPRDDARAAAELAGHRGPVTLTMGASTYQRLGGIEAASLLGTEDRWAVADYDSVSTQAKLSLALSEGVGLHVSTTRVLWVRNGPPDVSDVSVGLHRWFAPRQARGAMHAGRPASPRRRGDARP